VTGKFM